MSSKPTIENVIEGWMDNSVAAYRVGESLLAELSDIRANAELAEESYSSLEQERVFHRKQLAALTSERDSLRKRVEELEGGVDDFLNKLFNLIDDSSGVCGLHENGEVADWKSLLLQGQFEEWLGVPISKLEKILAGRDEASTGTA